MSASDPSPNSQDAPKGELALRTLAMPADTNPSGDIFGGWVMAQMDIAGGISACTYAPCNIHLRHNPAAKYIARWVRIRRHCQRA